MSKYNALKNRAKNNKGFTLVELIVVIVILAILIGVSVSGYSKYIGQSKLNTDIQNAETIRAAVVNAQGEPGVYEELLKSGNGNKKVTITINNTGCAIASELTGSAEGKDEFKDAIKAQLQLTDDTADKNTKIKTQYSGGVITITATTPTTPDGSATVTVAGTGYPNDTTAGILKPASGT